MTFSLNGTTITQSGTDNDLSGLAALTGVTYSELSNKNNDFRYLILPTSHKLVIEGDLTLDANTDSLVIPHTSGTFLCLDIAASGSLTITDQKSDGAHTLNYQKKALHILNQTDNHWNPANGVTISGDLIMKGGAIISSSHINFLANSSLTVEGDSLVAVGDAASGSANLFRFGNSQADVSIDGLILQGGSNAFETARIAQLDNYAPQFATEGIMSYGTVTLYGYNPQNCEKDFAFISSGSFYIVYGMADKSPSASVHFDHASASGGGWVKIRKYLNLTLLDEKGAPVANAVSFLKDTDHGQRYNKLEDLTADVTYLESSDANGLINHDLLLANIQVGAGENVGRDSAARVVDYRSKNNSHEYRMDTALFAYGYKPRLVNDIDLAGLAQSVDVALVLSEDSRITEPDPALVAAYSEITSAPQFYDAAKLWLVNNYEGQNQALVTIEGGDTIIADYDIVIDANASTAFDFDGSTITIKAQEFSGNLTLDADHEVTLNNGAAITRTVLDRHGDSAITFDGVSAWTVYESSSSRATGDNPLASGDGDTVFRFIYQPGLVYYLAVTIGNDQLLSDLSIDQPGITVFDLSETALLNQLNSKINTLIDSPSFNDQDRETLGQTHLAASRAASWRGH